MEPAYLLFDGTCRFCVANSKRLIRYARPGSIDRLDSHDPAVMARFPNVSFEASQRAIRLVMPDGRVFAGFEAIARVLATRWWLAPIAYLYYVPGLRQVLDALYRWIAANRHRFGGNIEVLGTCDRDACTLPGSPPAAPLNK